VLCLLVSVGRVVTKPACFVTYLLQYGQPLHMCNPGLHMLYSIARRTALEDYHVLVLQAVPMGTIERSSDANQPEFKPECHIFYGTRINDMNDDLPKWCVCFFSKCSAAAQSPQWTVVGSFRLSVI
jgi:hypothetical protein